MRRRSSIPGIVLLSIAIGALSVGVSSQTATTTRAKIPASGAASISKQLAGAVERGDTPGVVALVVDRDGVLYEGSAGKLDTGRNIPMPTNAIFNIASMTKPVTSVAIMMLLEEGRLKL